MARRRRSASPCSPVHHRTGKTRLAGSQDRQVMLPAGMIARTPSAAPDCRRPRRTGRDWHRQSDRLSPKHRDSGRSRSMHRGYDNTLNGSIYSPIRKSKTRDRAGNSASSSRGERRIRGRRASRRPASAPTDRPGSWTTATVDEGPGSAVRKLRPQFRGGARAPLANPLLCSARLRQPDLLCRRASTGTATPLSSPFTPGPGSVCATSAPFASHADHAEPHENANAGAYTPTRST